MTIHDSSEGYGRDRPELLDKPRAQAALGGISIPTLDRMRRRGELETVRIGRRVFFLAADVDDYIERHREPKP